MSNQIYLGKRNLLSGAIANTAGIWRAEDITQMLYYEYSGTVPPLYAFSGTATFTSGGATGRTGPSLAQARSGLSGAGSDTWKNDTNFFNTNGNGIMLWTVPATGTYRIDAYGAGGGQYFARGLGARMRGDFTLVRGEVIRILVGQPGSDGNSCTGSSGGGGTFVVKNSGNTEASILVIAGGGGGGGTNGYTGVNGTTSTNGTTDSSGTVAGGSGGAGGAQPPGNPCSISYVSGSGGGFNVVNGNGGGPGGGAGSTSVGGGYSFLNGGFGSDLVGANGSAWSPGGFGGGGQGNYGAGGGGGYSGGGGGWGSACDCSTWRGGGGGGSYNNGTNQLNTAGGNASVPGQVQITLL